MQRRYFFIEYITFLLVVFCLAVGGASLYFFLRFLIQFGDFNIISFIVFILLLCFSVFWFCYLRKVGFGQSTLPPNTFELKGINDEALIEKFSVYFNTGWSEIQTNDSKNSLYMLPKKHGIHTRILLLRPDMFDRTSFKQLKKHSNKIINHQNNINQYIPIPQIYKKSRINFVIMDTTNAYSTELLEQNATVLFSRVEAIVNLFYFRDNSTLCFPAHFGNGSFMKYHKVYRVIKKFVNQVDRL